MRYINFKLFDQIPQKFRTVMGYYPEVSLFKFDKAQYVQLWKGLSSSYIYANAYEIRPTNWFMHTFQSFKGWFGFDNYCDPQRVSYALNKLAYYGYTQKFELPECSLMGGYSLHTELLASCNYNTETTQLLQKVLIAEYLKVQPYFNIKSEDGAPVSQYYFGTSWANIDKWELIPLLDPQDEVLIHKTIQKLDEKYIFPGQLAFKSNSKYAIMASEYYYNKAKNPPNGAKYLRGDINARSLVLALQFDIGIAKKDPKFFIDYCINQKKYRPACDFLVFVTDENQILQYLLAIPALNRNALIEKNSPNAAILAKHYIVQNQYEQAQAIYTNIEALNPIVAFKLAVNTDFIEAYRLYKQYHSSHSFPELECKMLAEIFYNKADASYRLGYECEKNKDWRTAKKHYFVSLEQKKAAYALNHLKDYLEDLYIHKRLYAQILINADIDLNSPAASHLADMQKAVMLLKECKSSDDSEQEDCRFALAKGLMRQVDTFCEQISLTNVPPLQNETERQSYLVEHKQKHQDNLRILTGLLKELIILLKGTKNPDLCLKLGKAHYLLADIHEFLDLNKSEYSQHYKLAMEVVPGNPFYILRVASDFEDGKNQLVVLANNKLNAMNYTMDDYWDWRQKDQWVKRSDVISIIRDIHDPVSTSAQPSVRTCFGL